MKHLKVKILNTYPLPINIDWYIGSMKRFYTIQPNESAILEDVIRLEETDDSTITFEAWDMKNKNMILMNGRKMFIIPLIAAEDSISEDIKLTKGR